VPPEVGNYRLGNRTAIEWVLDQYREKKPRDRTVAIHFNRYDFRAHKERVIALIKRIVTVSVATMKIINEI